MTTVRQRALDAITLQPGIHFRGIMFLIGIRSSGQMEHHLRQLERQQKVRVVRDGKFKRYFLPDYPTPEARARISRPRAMQIMVAVGEGAKTRGQLRHILNCTDSTVGYHLNRLLHNGDVVRTRRASDNQVVYGLPVRA